MSSNDSQNSKKEEVKQRIDKLDPNNNKNLPQKPMVKKRGHKEHDDVFEHRTSEEISPAVTPNKGA